MKSFLSDTMYGKFPKKGIRLCEIQSARSHHVGKCVQPTRRTLHRGNTPVENRLQGVAVFPQTKKLVDTPGRICANEETVDTKIWRTWSTDGNVSSSIQTRRRPWNHRLASGKMRILHHLAEQNKYKCDRIDLWILTDLSGFWEQVQYGIECQRGNRITYRKIDMDQMIARIDALNGGNM